METWRKVWREGLAPLLSTAGLEALRLGLMVDDPRLLQGATTAPPLLRCIGDSPVEAACLIGYCGWQGEHLKTVAEVEEFFARICSEADQRLGEPADFHSACHWFLTWYDKTPRDEIRRQLLPEVNRTLAQRREPIEAEIQEALDFGRTAEQHLIAE